MIVSHVRRTLFVHVQKTGGTTVSAWLRETLPGALEVSAHDGGGKHAPLSRLVRADPALHGYFVCGFVRNPWARMESWYRMVRRRASSPASLTANAFYREAVVRLPTFASFVMEGPELFDRLGRPQIRYLTARGSSADFIGRTEQMDVDTQRLAEMLSIDPPPPRRLNAGHVGADYRSAYTPALRDRVGELFADDVAAFGYDF